jgi:hypothetical protein
MRLISWAPPRCSETPISPLKPSNTSMAVCLLHGPSAPPPRPSALSIFYATTLCPPYGPMYVPSTAICPPLWHSILFMTSCFLNSPPSPRWLSVPSIALFPVYGSLSSLRPSVSSTAICSPYISTLYGLCPLYYSVSSLRPYVPSTDHCPRSLYGPLSSLWPSVSSTALCPLKGPRSRTRPSALSTASCLLYSQLFPLKSCVPSMVLWPTACPLYYPLSNLRPSVHSMTLFPLYGPMSPLRPLPPLWPSITSMALYPLYSSLSSLLPYVSSTALFCSMTLIPSKTLCPLYSLLSPLQLSVPSMAPCPLYSPLCLLGFFKP